jgi:hypothetical protein
MSKKQKKLLQYFEQLNKESQNSLIEFAEFLTSKKTNLEKIIDLSEPEFYSGPEGESVIGALKRLQKIYSMVNTNDIFNDVSKLMTGHILQGLDKDDVIPEIEILFKNNYTKLTKENK